MPEPPPSPPVSDHETTFEYLVRHVAMLHDREAQLGASASDGLTAAQADEVVEKLRVVYEWQGDQMPPSPVWEAFRAAVDAETSWLFEDQDPLAAAITWALRRLEDTLGGILENTGVFPREDIDKYVSLAVVSQGARRQVALGKGGFNWKLVYAHGLYWIGGKLKRFGDRLKR